MKYMKRANLYQCSNYNCTFNPDTIEAFSYRWWRFVAVIGGKVVFNAYRYSNSTSKHQSKVRSLMRELGIKIDREVQVEHGLKMNTVRELNKAEKETLESLRRDEENRRIRRNERARQQRSEKKMQTQAIVTHASHESQTFHFQALRLVK